MQECTYPLSFLNKGNGENKAIQRILNLMGIRETQNYCTIIFVVIISFSFIFLS